MKGFSIILEEEKFKIRFYHAPENNVVVCLLEDAYENIYRGKARCNTLEGDVYDEKEGEAIALRKALDKFQRTRAKNLNRLFSLELKSLTKADYGIYQGWERRRIKEDERILPF